MKDVKGMTVKNVAVLFFLSDDSCHQVCLDATQGEVVKAFVGSMFPGSVPLVERELSLSVEKRSKP